jgi:hypothetical protein
MPNKLRRRLKQRGQLVARMSVAEEWIASTYGLAMTAKEEDIFC